MSLKEQMKEELGKTLVKNLVSLLLSIMLQGHTYCGLFSEQLELA